MDFFEIARNRRSVRGFSVDEVSDEQIACLLDAARCAPSAGNCQPWKFVVVRNREIIQRFYPDCYRLEWIITAKAVIVVCMDLARAKERYGERGLSLFGIQDTAAAAENILLGAEAMGLASCWVGWFDETACAKLLGLGDTLRPVILLPIGIAAARPAAERSLRPLEEVVSYLD